MKSTINKYLDLSYYFIISNRTTPFYSSTPIWKSGGIYDPNEIRRARKRRKKGMKQ